MSALKSQSLLKVTSIPDLHFLLDISLLMLKITLLLGPPYRPTESTCTTELQSLSSCSQAADAGSS